MDDPVSSSHLKFAGRSPAGTELPVALAKNGNRHIRRLPSGETNEILSVGLACSECFSGANLAKVLKPGFEYEQKVMEQLMAGEFAGPLSIHTSAGVPEALGAFVDALEPLLPWKDTEELDWCVSLQLEGASAVWAGIDMLLQHLILSTGTKNRKKVAVGANSYHGPPSTSFGAKAPLWQKHHQLKYPVPTPDNSNDHSVLISEFEAFLNEHGDEIGVMLVEPQWGSSQAALPWPTDLLKTYIHMARARGIKILCDEIMCGLGRHGKGTLFVSEALELDPDCITFGKAIGGGVYPLSGAIIKQGRAILQANESSVMQSHTYAGSSVRALMTAAAVLKELPNWFASIAKNGEEMDRIFRYLAQISKGMLTVQGQGLMWGCLLSRDGQNKDERYRADAFSCFKKHCEAVGILPYFVPVGGFMITPLMDADVGTIYEIGTRMEEVIVRTLNEMKWDMQWEEPQQCLPVADTDSKCNPMFHATKACTSCAAFVPPAVRSRFARPL